MSCLDEVLSYEGEVDVPAGENEPVTEWSCGKIFDFLHSYKLCTAQSTKSVSSGLICTVWAACADDATTDDAPTFDDDAYKPVECDATTCDVAHPAWLGDGYCDDDEPCYNTAACGWDGGDCCAATCEDRTASALACGDAGFVCRDPDAQGCAAAAQAEVHVGLHQGVEKTSAWGADLTLYSVLGTSYVPVSRADAAAAPGQTKSACLAAGCYVVEVEPDATFSRDAEWAVTKRHSHKDGVAAEAATTTTTLASGTAPDVCMFAAGYEEGSAAKAAVEVLCPTVCASAAFSETACAPSDLFLMIMRDAGYNGWFGIHYSIHRHDTAGQRGEEMKRGRLAMGHMGVDAVCIQEPGCYTVTLEQGWWQEEVSWTLGRVGQGAVAQGGAPSSCDFSVGSTSFCANTCMPSADSSPWDDADDIEKDDGSYYDCATGESGHNMGGGGVLHQLELYERDGSGWGGASYVMTEHTTKAETTGTLGFGYQSEDEVCLVPGCYTFAVDGPRKTGMEWALGSKAGGLVLSGSTAAKAAATCVFAVPDPRAAAAGDEEPPCEVTCTAGGSITEPPTPTPTCPAGERRAVMRMSDAWADGWDGAYFSIYDDGATAPNGSSKPIATNTLEDGAYGEFAYCLAEGCYRVEVTSGKWRDEISWDLADETDPSKEVIFSSGAAPEVCDFAVGGAACADVGCHSGMRPAGEDPEDKDDHGDDNNDDMYSYGDFDNDDDFWLQADDAADRGASSSSSSSSSHCTSGTECSFTELISGWFAVGATTECVAAAVDPEDAAFDPFDQAVWADRPKLCLGTYDFKELDAFEACAEELDRDFGGPSPTWSTRRGEKAKECMKILLTAVPDRSDDKAADDDLVLRIATMTYYYGNAGFCDCAATNGFAPACRDFLDFNAVVREAREACHALDQVDCAYFAEYLDECQRTLPAKFGYIDLSDAKQCEYIEADGCGGLAIPAVRRGDCFLEDNAEMTPAQRQFITDVFSDCNGGGGGGNAPSPAPNDDGSAKPPVKPSRKKKSSYSGPNVAAIVVPIIIIILLLLGAAAVYVYKIRPDLLGLLPAWVPAVARGGSASDEPATELGYAFSPLDHGDDTPPRGV